MNGNYCVRVDGKAEVAREVLKKLIGWKHPHAAGWLSSTYNTAILHDATAFKLQWERSSNAQTYITFEVADGYVYSAYSGSNNGEYKDADLKTLLAAKVLDKALKVKLVKHRSLKKRLEEVTASLKECNEVLRGHVATNNLTSYSPFTKAFERSRDILAKYAKQTK
jgi:hypothetical protein